MGAPELVRFGSAGTVSVAPTSATLPTDKDSALAGFSDLGTISEDGVMLSRSVTSEDLKGWGVGVVRTTITDTQFTAKFTCLETNVDTLGLWLGADPAYDGADVSFEVPGLASVVTKAVVIDWEETIDAVPYQFRCVMPRASIESYGDVSINSNNATGYEVTFKALADDNGKAAYFYSDGTALGAS